MSEGLYIESWPKQCACGNIFTEDGWELLPYVGVQRSELDGFPDLEMRSCTQCYSTVAIALPIDFVEHG